MEKIIQAARLEKIEPDSVKQTKLAKMIEHDIIFLGGFTKNWLKLKNRPTPAQRKTALKKIEKATHTLNGILKTLDGDSTDDLRKAMLSDPFSRQALGTDPEVYPGHRTRGHAQFQTLFDIIYKLEDWSKIAQEQTNIPKDGDKPADVKRWFAEGIIKIWIRIGYEKPTLIWRRSQKITAGALMEFAEAAARPLGLEPIEAALREEIKVWKKRGPEPPPKYP